MKKLLLTLIVSFALCGASFAQETHWPDFNPNIYELYDGVVAFVQIDGEYVGVDGNWENLEIAALVDGEVRATAFMEDYTEEGDPYPLVDLMVWYLSQGGTNKTVTFQMYDHASGTLYEDCTPNMDIITGTDHLEIYWALYDDAPVLNFTSPAATGITKDITGYGEGNGNWYLIASPVGEVNPAEVENMLQNDFDLYYFDQAGDDGLEWINRKVEDGLNDFNLMPGQGYLYANSNDVTLTFNGPAYTDPVSVELVKFMGTAFSGWNLVGNPYNEDAYIDRSFYRMNEEGTELMSEMSTGAIEPMEGVFVLAEEESEMMAFSTEAPGDKAAALVMNLTQNRGGAIDRAIVSFGNETLPKLQLNPNSTKVYIPQDGSDYAVVSAGEMGEMPVSFKAAENGTYTLGFACQEVSFCYLHLIDNLTGSDTDLLASPSYTFEANTTDYASRFRLVFATGNAAEDSFAFFSNGNLVVNNDGDATLQVVDVTGRILSSQNISGSASVNVNAAPGVYMVRLVNGDSMKVQKVVVK